MFRVDKLIVENCTLEPYSFDTGDQRDPIIVTEFYIVIKVDGIMFKSEKHYDGRSIKDKG